MNNSIRAGAVMLLLVLSACGGGGSAESSGGGSSNTTPPPSTTTPPASTTTPPASSTSPPTSTSPPPTSTTPVSTSTNQAVGGIWTSQYSTSSGANAGDVINALAIVSENGQYFEYAKNSTTGCASVGSGHLASVGSTLSGSADFVQVQYMMVPGVSACLNSDGSSGGSDAISGAITQRVSATFIDTDTTSLGTVLPASTEMYAFSSLYLNPSSLNTIAGSYTDGSTTLSITDNGAVSGQDSNGCALSGNVSIINASYDVYAVQMTFATCAGAQATLSGVSVSGLIILDSTQAPAAIVGGIAANGTAGSFAQLLNLRLNTDLGCASNFITDPTSGNITADWTTRLGCSDNYQQPAAASPVHIVIEPSANIWAVSDVKLASALSGSVFNLTAGEIDNYGSFTTVGSSDFPYACSYYNTSGSVITPTGTGNIVINNYGTIGENYNSKCGPVMVFPTVLYQPHYSIVLNNYNAVWAVNGTQGFIGGISGSGPGTAATINNYSGARIGTSTGSPLNQGNANNYRNAGMFDTDATWSWCEHGNGAWFFNNWGYCIAAEQGIYQTTPSSQSHIALYGGPLIPSALDINGNLVFGGSISASVSYGKWANASLCTADGAYALDSSAPILVGNNATENDPFASVDLYNTVYSYTDPTDGTAKTVNYLPLLYQYPMIGSGAHITLHFDQLYADEATQLMSDVAAGNRAAGTSTFFQVFDGVSDTFVAPAAWASKGTSNDAGYTYSWCNTAPIVTSFTNTQKITRPPPQVYFINPAGSAGGARQYFTDPNGANGNSYYLVNPTTVRLAGNVPQPSGTLYVGPGWTLAVGAKLSTTTPLNLPNLVGSSLTLAQMQAMYGIGTAGYSTANLPASFTFNPNSTIHLQSASGTTTDNVDNQPTPVTETLVGSLVIDNIVDSNGTYPVSLPNLVGGGNLIQMGNSTTTLMGANNNLSGSIYIYDGSVIVDAAAGFATPPNVVFGQNDGNYVVRHPVLDLSQVTTPTFPVNSVTMSGPQMGVANIGTGTGLIYPTILLGKTVLTLTSSSGASDNHLEAVLTGTGGIDIKPGVSLALGYWATQDAGGSEKAYDLSTFSGGTTVEAGATLNINSRGALGYGNLTNAGAVALAGTRQYLTTWLNASGPLPNAPQGTLAIGAQLVNATTPLLNTLNNHTVFVKGNYSQAATGNLTLRVRQGDLDTASLGSGAGVQYETVVVGGSASLNGTLTIQFMSGYTLPAGGVLLAIVQAGAPITGTFSTVQTTTDGVTFTPHPLASQQVVSVNQPIGGGSTSVLELTLR